MRYGRKAFGPQRRISDQTKIRNLAEGLLAHMAAGNIRHPEDYGYTSEHPVWQGAQRIIHNGRQGDIAE